MEVWRLAFICSLVSCPTKEQGMYSTRCMGFHCPLKQAFGMPVVLVTREFENRDFVLMCSTNLDSFQLTVFILMGTACWSVERGGEKGE